MPTPTRPSRIAVPRRCFVKPVRSAALLSSPRPSLRRGHPSKYSPRPQPYRVTAAPCPLDVSGVATAPAAPAVSLRCHQVVPSPSRRPASPGPCSVNESVAMSARLRCHHPVLPWASLAPATVATTHRVHPPRVASCRSEDRPPAPLHACTPRSGFAHATPGTQAGPASSPPLLPTEVDDSVHESLDQGRSQRLRRVLPEG